MLTRVLLCLAPASLAERIQALVEDPQLIVERVRGQRANHWPQALRRARDLVVLGRDLLPNPSIEHLKILCSTPGRPEVVVLGTADDPEDRATLLAAGAAEVLPTGLPDRLLSEVIQRIVARRRDREAERLRTSRPGGEPRLSDFASSSRAMRTFMDVVHRVVDSKSALLLLGETGVGKERLARAIHAEGPSSSGPFVAVNCGAIPETLLESELFGHEKGAFTGATQARRGWFELGHGGTVFLDEVGEMPKHLQVKLLRVLQDHTFQPLGSEREMRVDVRIIGATNSNLAADVDAGLFRRDLYYRLGVITLEVPALRDRREDIPELLQSYIRHFAQVLGREVTGIDGDTRDALVAYPWPGNVRELANGVERAVLLCEGEELGFEDFPPAVVGADRREARASNASPPDTRRRDEVDPGWLDRPLREVRQQAIQDLERAYLSAQLERTSGRVGETARRAGIQPRSLFDKMRRLGLHKEDYYRR